MLTIGIDLGTTNSVAAVYKNGEVRVLETYAGELFTPSVVSFQGEAVLVGRYAWHNALMAPTDTIFSVKRLMGQSAGSEPVRSMQERYPYRILSADNEESRGIQVFLNGRQYTPEEISAMILRQIVADAEATLKEPIRHAVITVPAYFSDPQRAATREAGEKAGLVIQSIIDEPTAAAIAFGTQDNQFQTVLVFDMGGGTLDISLLEMGEQSYACVALGGDRWLGGDDFDQAIVEMIIEWVKGIYEAADVKDASFLMKARRAAEKAKKTLTEKVQTNVTIPGALSLPGGQALSVNMSLTRAEFEARIKPLVDRCKQLVEDTLRSEDREPGEINTVLLVGGTTYVPLVRQMLAELFGEEKLSMKVNPMLAVARGAAIKAGVMEGVACPECEAINGYEQEQCKQCGSSLALAEEVGGLWLGKAMERPLGIGVVRNNKTDVFSVLIEKGTPFPLANPKRRRYLTTNQKITIPVYKGEKEQASANEYLGLVEYTLRDVVPPRTPVWVSFNYDRNRLLKVRIEVDGFPTLTHEAEPRRHALDPNRVNDDEWVAAIQNGVRFATVLMTKYGEFIEEDAKEHLNTLIDQAEMTLSKKDKTRGREVLSELTQALNQIETASHLLMVDHLMHEVDSKTAEWLGQQSKQLRDAYRDGNAIQVQQIKENLNVQIKHIQETSPTVKALDGQGYGGLLEEMSQKEGEKS